MLKSKKMFLISIFTILLCIAMLISTTFAWFTDTASTSINKIESGKLDVKLEMSIDGITWKNGESKTLNFLQRDEENNIVENSDLLWEPGCSFELPQLRVVNNGNLSLKYKIIITGIDGDSRLNEVIDWTINDADINSADYYLDAKQTDEPFVIKAKMKESAGNEYKNLSIEGIGITVVATQYTNEYDSYSNQYDIDAKYPNVMSDINETKNLLISAELGGDAKSDKVEIRIPKESVEVDTDAIFSVKQTAYTNSSLTYEISLVDSNKNETITLLQPATITLDVDQDLDIIAVYHNDNPLTKENSADVLNNQGYYYDVLEGKLYICSSSFSPFRIEFASKFEEEFIAAIYLSDISYDKDMTIPGSTSEAWGEITMDKTAKSDGGNPLSLLINGETVSFKKGIFAHAKSTVVYDLSEYDCDYFSCYYGISSLRGNKGNVKFYIYTSIDGENWTLETSDNPSEMSAATNASFVKINISGKKYLNLYADDNGGTGNDHAIYCDAKIYKEGYTESLLPSVIEYDEQIKVLYNGEITDEIEYLLLKRELVSNVGQYTLKSFVDESEANKEVFNILLNDVDMLRLYLLGGKPEGTYLKSLEVLSKLYAAYGQDLNNNTISKYGNRLGDLYRTMMLAISLTHSGNVYLWVDGSAVSDPIKRYEIYKELHSLDLIQSEVFESLTIEEMRFVMNTIIDDEEIKWLNNYVANVKNGATGPYSYIKYTFGYNYTLDKYYSVENYDMWDEKYDLSTWGVPYEEGHPKLWIVFEEGAVCGGLSKTGSCIWGTYMGLPNTCVSQPAHCAYIYYIQVNGNGVWGLGNNVSGWGKSGKTEHLGVRMMNDWGNSVGGWSASYILLAQAAQNEYDKYEDSEIILMLADVYKNDLTKLEELYRKALSIENINYDAWLGLINLYLSSAEKGEDQYYDLAEEIATTLTYYPRPMYDLVSKLEDKTTSSAIKASFTMLKTRTLTTATNATDTQTIQKSAVVEVAKQLLGTTDSTIATFSFDGDNANQIVLGSQFEGSDVAWDYSLDNGLTWNQCTENKHTLSTDEIDSITIDNDIKVHIIGVDYSDSNIYTIDIKDSQGIPSTIYANDLEDRIIGTTDTMEWRYSENEGWISFKDALPDLTGNKIVTVRVGATSIYKPSNTTTYTFAEDTLPATMKYISIDNLSIADFSSETNPNTDYYKRDWKAIYAIDGNINTLWHSDPRNIVANRYITIKLNEPLYISALDYLPSSANNGVGVIKDADIYASSDNENWIKVASFTNSPKTYTVKQVQFEPILAQYIKLDITKAHYSNDVFANAAMINLYYDSTKVVD